MIADVVVEGYFGWCRWDMQVIEIKLDIKPAGGLTAAMNDIKLKSHNQSFAESGSYKEIREYTYFDSTVSLA